MNGSWNGHGFPRLVFIFLTIGVALPESVVPNEDWKANEKEIQPNSFNFKESLPNPTV